MKLYHFRKHPQSIIGNDDFGQLENSFYNTRTRLNREHLENS